MYGILNEMFRTASMTQPQVYVVSDSTLKSLQDKQQARTLKAIDDQIETLQTYRQDVEDSVGLLESTKK